MRVTRSSLQALLPVLIGALLLHGVVALTPHQHDSESGHIRAVPTDHWCSHDTQEIFPSAEIHVSAPCLVCVIPTPAFAQTDHPVFVVSRTSAAADVVESDQLPAPNRRWQILLRGPPCLA
jgi:hypothetical protein